MKVNYKNMCFVEMNELIIELIKVVFCYSNMFLLFFSYVLIGDLEVMLFVLLLMVFWF